MFPGICITYFQLASNYLYCYTSQSVAFYCFLLPTHCILVITLHAHLHLHYGSFLYTWVPKSFGNFLWNYRWHNMLQTMAMVKLLPIMLINVSGTSYHYWWKSSYYIVQILSGSVILLCNCSHLMMDCRNWVSI